MEHSHCSNSRIDFALLKVIRAELQWQTNCFKQTGRDYPLVAKEDIHMCKLEVT